MKVSDTAAAFGGDGGPGGNVGVTGVGINFRALTKNNFGNFGGILGKTVKAVNQGRKVNFGRILSQGVEKGLKTNMGWLKRMDGNFQIGLEGRTVGTEMVGDRIGAG